MFKERVLSKKSSTTLCQQLSGVGPRIAERLARIHILTIEDLLFHLPLRYEDRTRVQCMNKMIVGENYVIDGVIKNISFPLRGRTKLLLDVEDATGKMALRFFNLSQYQKRLFQIGQRIRCFGEARLGLNGIEFIHPEYQIISMQDVFESEKYLTPIYPTTEGVSQNVLRKLIHQALIFLEKDFLLQEFLPSEILQSLHFLSLKETLFCIHRPSVQVSIEQLNARQHISQQRLIFEELLAHRLALLHMKNTFQQQCAPVLLNQHRLTKQFLQQLPFQLTHAQQRVINEIQQDLSKHYPMLRLVQGDVGSGKTVVAAVAILQAIENGGQVALLVPTELLAEQHFQTFQRWFEPLGVQVALLTSSMKASVKQKTLTDLLENKISLLIGTHAIFQTGIQFSHLVLLIIDEQHRFGVEQRALLREKGIDGNIFPHQLVMTATPIPRTLAMSLYADFDCSVIDELPPGRSPIVTRVVSTCRKEEILTHLKAACAAGSQVYWVCALIEESEVLQCQTALDTFQQLVVSLPEFKIGLLHGRMKPVEKEQIMTAFRAGMLQILVATTVIEVGVDVPAANLMIIENAERFGLAQLHQLRGRIGRGDAKSFCLLVYQSPLSPAAQERLTVMRNTTDGFKIAERDLELRGAGEVLGVRQTGEISLKIADLLRDSALFPKVQMAAGLIFKKYVSIVEPLTYRWLGEAKKYGQV